MLQSSKEGCLLIDLLIERKLAFSAIWTTYFKIISVIKCEKCSYNIIININCAEMFETEVEKSAKLILPRANTNIFTWYAVKKS